MTYSYRHYLDNDLANQQVYGMIVFLYVHAAKSRMYNLPKQVECGNKLAKNDALGNSYKYSFSGQRHVHCWLLYPSYHKNPLTKMHSIGIVRFFLTVLLLPTFCSCDSNDSFYEISEIRLESEPSSNIKLNATPAERFSPNQGSPDAETSGQAQLPLTWDTPAGWQELPATSMRLLNFRVAGHPDAECYLSILPGSGGGVEENITRWRNQMSLSPLSAEDISRLPRKKLLNNDAVYVECSGTFVGMRGDLEKEDYKLVGMILGHKNITVFVKMVGPKAILESEIDRYHSFCSSLQIAHDDVESKETLEDTSEEVKSTSELSWEAPQAWSLGPERKMRVVTYRTNINNQTECYVSVLAGNAGGVYQNVNRWRRQMEQPELDPNTIDNLPTIQVLGHPARLVEIEGNYTGMSGPVHNDFMMLGVVCPLPDRTIFVKMTGPKSDVIDERKNFLTFCESLKFN